MEKLTIRDDYNRYETVCDDDGNAIVLGKGKFGITVKARLEASGKDFAIKILHPETATSAGATRRFVREIRALQDLKHRNLIKYYGADANDEGEMFLVMELGEGGSLASFVSEHGKLSERCVAETALQIIKGLKETHSKGYLHRDLKPSNLLLAEKVTSRKEYTAVLSKNKAFIKVADFGLVGQLSEQGEVRRGKFGGTVLFASPEQFQERNLDVRSDFYSLGMTMWFLVNGGNPFKTGGEQKIDIQTASRLHTDESIHIESAAMKALNLSSGFTKLLGKLLGKDREKRFQNADAVEKAIVQFLHDDSKKQAPARSQNRDKGTVRDFFEIKQELPELLPREGITVQAVEKASGEECMLTIWDSSEDSESSLGRYLKALKKFSGNQSLDSSLVPINKVIRTKAEWCVAEPVIKGIPLSAYFEEDLKADISEITKVLNPVAETIDALAREGFEFGSVSADSVYIVPKENDEYFLQGRWRDESMSQWPDWRILFSGISLPLEIDPQKASSFSTFATTHERSGSDNGDSLETKTEICQTISVVQSDVLDPPLAADADETIQITLGGGPEHNFSVVKRDRNGPGGIYLFPNFCRLVFRLFAGRNAATAASWAPGAFVPTENLSDKKNQLLRDHISESGTIESAGDILSEILREEPSIAKSGSSVKKAESQSRRYFPAAAALFLLAGVIAVVGFVSKSMKPGQLISTKPVPVVEPETEPEPEIVRQPVEQLAIVNDLKNEAVESRPELKSPPLLTFETEDVPVSLPAKSILSAMAPEPSDPGEPESLVFTTISADDPELNLKAAHSASASIPEKIEFFENAARILEKQGEREQARSTYLELAELAEAEEPEKRAAYLASADRLEALGVKEWTYIYENTKSDELSRKYRKRAIAQLSGTDPAEAFSRLMDFAGKSEAVSDRLEYYTWSASLPNLPKDLLRTAYEKMADTGGFEENLQLYDFLRSNTSYQQDAIAVGKKIYEKGTPENLPERIKIARELWDRFDIVAALRWISDNQPEGFAKQKARWEYYNETQEPAYANAANVLSTDQELPERVRGRYAWRYFETLSIKERETDVAKRTLNQAISAGVNEAIVYRDRTRQIEESRIAAEMAKQAAVKVAEAAHRIDSGLKSIVAQRIDKNGKLDEAAYKKKIAELTALLEHSRKVDTAEALQPQRGNIFWWRFTTWEEAVGLMTKRSPYASRSLVRTQIEPTAYKDLSTAAELGNWNAKARLASILAGASPVKPLAPDEEGAARLAGEVYQGSRIGRTEAKLVLRHLLQGDRETKNRTHRVLEAMNIDSSKVLN